MTAPGFLAPPVISAGQNRSCPLSATLKLACENAVSAPVEIAQRDARWTIEFPLAGRRREELCLLGFLPEGAAQITVRLAGADGSRSAASEQLVFRPEPVPSGPLDMPPVHVSHAEPERMAPGYTFLSVRRRAIGRVQDLTPAQRRFCTQWGQILALDSRGRVRWLKQLEKRPAGLHRMASGNLFVHDTEFCSRELDYRGEVVNAWYAAGRPNGPEPRRNSGRRQEPASPAASDAERQFSRNLRPCKVRAELARLGR